ncbi:MAG: zeta toxin family protein [Undibacterium sp.]|uniref:zeta toxin family protein n=1 Tax=Undibacterium sp. TaxID=1914977 RepID=UPI00271C178E|nr:zeta toxin family protein [Undibacterium sp.]MDO8654362.1 zeta toxin family protein [Undibacterium sp.]
MSQPHVIVIGGPNGAGKSTIAPLVLRDYLEVPDFVNADQIAAGLSAFNPEGAAFEAGRIMLRRLDELAASGKSFAFESTLSSRTFSVFLKRLKSQGYHVGLCFVWINSVELAKQRVSLRVKMGGHHIPDDVIERRYARSIQNFRNLYLPLADEWSLFDNSELADPILIAEGCDNQAATIFEEASWNKIQTI